MVSVNVESPVSTEKPMDLVLSFDTTGSMSACIQEVQKCALDLINRLFNDFPNLRISIIAHGDYCDHKIPACYVIKWVDFTDDINELCRFIHTAGGTTGGDWEECYELVLRRAQSQLSWRCGSRRTLIMMGDAMPHPPDDPQNEDHINWRMEAYHLADRMGVRIHSVQFLSGQAYYDERASEFWESLAALGQGRHLVLKSFPTVVDVILAIAYREKGASSLRAYEAEVLGREEMVRKELEDVFSNLRIMDKNSLDPNQNISTPTPAPSPGATDPTPAINSTTFYSSTKEPIKNPDPGTLNGNVNNTNRFKVVKPKTKQTVSTLKRPLTSSKTNTAKKLKLTPKSKLALTTKLVKSRFKPNKTAVSELLAKRQALIAKRKDVKKDKNLDEQIVIYEAVENAKVEKSAITGRRRKTIDYKQLAGLKSSSATVEKEAVASKKSRSTVSVKSAPKPNKASSKPVKKGPGRPPKNSSEKRKPGRPPATVEKPRKKPGRPPKNQQSKTVKKDTANKRGHVKKGKVQVKAKKKT